jgi:hypothetical protein
MPDWTYQPLRGIAATLLGTPRSQRAALHIVAVVSSVRAGRWLISRGLGHRPGSFAGRLGAIVPPTVARDAIRALPAIGAGRVEIAPVSLGADDVQVTDPSVDKAADLLRQGKSVLVSPSVLIEAGPGWFNRVAEAATTTRPSSSRQWQWGLVVGLGMIVAALGAAAITLGPVLLWYDREYLGMDVGQLHAINHHLVHFLRHDRITMAGTMAAIGVLYCGLSLGGLRRGWSWARDAFLVSGWTGFPTLLYFLGHGFVEPLHTAATLVLLPMFVTATWRHPSPQWTVRPEGSARERNRALTGQLLFVLVGVGLFVGGATVSVAGLTDVFVASDLRYLGTTSDALQAANSRLLPFVAHDRAGFGGALMSAAAAITLLSAWGWRRGEAWVWWTLALAAAAGFVPVVVTHSTMGYLDFWHLAPVYVGVGMTVVALALSRAYLVTHSSAWRGASKVALAARAFQPFGLVEDSATAGVRPLGVDER